MAQNANNASNKPAKKIALFVGGYDGTVEQLSKKLKRDYGFDETVYFEQSAYKNKDSCIVPLGVTLIVLSPRAMGAPVISSARLQAASRKINYLIADTRQSEIIFELEKRGYIHRKEQVDDKPEPETVSKVQTPAIVPAAVKTVEVVMSPAKPVEASAPPPAMAPVIQMVPSPPPEPPKPVNPNPHFGDQRPVMQLPMDVKLERANFITAHVRANGNVSTEEIQKAFQNKYHIALGVDGLRAYVRAVGIDIPTGRKLVPYIREALQAADQEASARALKNMKATPSIPVSSVSTAVEPMPNEGLPDAVRAAMVLLRDELIATGRLEGFVSFKVVSKGGPQSEVEVDFDLKQVVVASIKGRL